MGLRKLFSVLERFERIHKRTSLNYYKTPEHFQKDVNRFNWEVQRLEKTNNFIHNLYFHSILKVLFDVLFTMNKLTKHR